MPNFAPGKRAVGSGPFLLESWDPSSVRFAANAAGGPRISRPSGRVAAWVIPTNEELMIAQHTRRLLAGRPG